LMKSNGAVVWITGLSAAGKTTLGRILVEKLTERSSSVIFLDGDEIRQVLGEFTTHTREDRVRLASTYSKLCKYLADQNTTVVIATVALFKEVHSWNRANITKYVEVYLDVPLEELKRRDPKGIYKKFQNGELINVAGLDMRVDFPNSPHLHFKYEQCLSPIEMSEIIIRHMKSKSYLISQEIKYE
jgi:cytidine diphosphoramidate kinase